MEKKLRRVDKSHFDFLVVLVQILQLLDGLRLTVRTVVPVN